jgi:hypothetical protein
VAGLSCSKQVVTGGQQAPDPLIASVTLQLSLKCTNPNPLERIDPGHDLQYKQGLVRGREGFEPLFLEWCQRMVAGGTSVCTAFSGTPPLGIKKSCCKLSTEVHCVGKAIDQKSGRCKTMLHGPPYTASRHSLAPSFAALASETDCTRLPKTDYRTVSQACALSRPLADPSSNSCTELESFL